MKYNPHTDPERLMKLIEAVCTDANWRKSFGQQEIRPALDRIKEFVTFGALAKKQGLMITQDQETGELNLIERPVEPKPPATAVAPAEIAVEIT